MSVNVPAGARWYKFEFHCHTPASDDYGKGPNQATLKERTPREWLLEYMMAEIDCVAVTDHNTGVWIDKLKLEYNSMKCGNVGGFRELTIFPGVEISAQAGKHTAHILGIFAPTAMSNDITLLIGRLGFRGGEIPNHKKIADCSALEVCKRIVDAGGVAIPAHVHDDCGLFKELGGNNLEQFLNAAPCFALEATLPRARHPQAYVNLNLKWTEVVGSDAHHPSGVSGEKFPESKFTWVKMGSEPCIEGLQLALHDGHPFSIRRSDENQVHSDPTSPLMKAYNTPVDPNKQAESTIESITISKGQYIGQGKPLELQFSPWLNCIVGGRGSGKSTLVEMARHVLRRGSELSDTGEPERNFKAFARVYDKKRVGNGEPPGALTAATEISMIYRVGANRYQLRWNQDAQGSSIEEEKTPGFWAPAQGTITTRFPVRIYSQKQVYSLARDSAGLLRIIDDSPEVGYADWKARWNHELARFMELRANARRIEAGFADQTRVVGLLEDVKKKLAVFERAGHADVLKNYQQCRRQKLRMAEIIEHAEPLPESVLKVIDDIELPTLDEETFADAPGLEELQAANDKLITAVGKARSELLRISEELKAELGGFGEAVWKSTWAKAVEDAEKKFETLKQQLAAVGTNDPNEYGRLVQQRQGYESQLKKIESQKQQLQTVRKEAKASYQHLEDLRRELTQKRSAFLAEALQGNRFVRISVIPYGNFSGVEETFRRLIGKEGATFAKDILQDDGAERSGLLADLYEGYAEVAAPNTVEFENKLCTLKQDIAKARREATWGVRTKLFVSHLVNMQPEQVDRIVAWWPEDSLKIEYSNGLAEGKWRSISEGSPGQQTAAMLAFLLSYGTEPMILDQPEDDLDNHLIYDLIVTQIRQNKTKRQIIIVTHNANIVVNGDAELVVAMDFRAGQCRIGESGCLQEKTVRDEICRVMEGGREAFKNRYRRVILENK